MAQSPSPSANLFSPKIHPLPKLSVLIWQTTILLPRQPCTASHSHPLPNSLSSLCSSSLSLYRTTQRKLNDGHTPCFCSLVSARVAHRCSSCCSSRSPAWPPPPLPPSPELSELELVKRSRLGENGVAAMAFVRLRVAPSPYTREKHAAACNLQIWTISALLLYIAGRMSCALHSPHLRF